MVDSVVSPTEKSILLLMAPLLACVDYMEKHGVEDCSYAVPHFVEALVRQYLLSPRFIFL